ncbi:GntR family transcriptional regulator [Streptomyces sp. H27-C3]|uniref:GntR family transcriptional regulator n=1 Tax=Streptomyces sp. H27-C3 TaxID=3046305 RepID=UPI0024B8FEEB|nr:GntR family transcriptional regulator [Streptomyces sp. H27-C3]MDJ0465038.1 GntR family transcriptional regulator [Streptomyces sp. H27-C3]
MAQPAYLRVAEAIRLAIEAGEENYQPGAGLPSSSDIAEAHGVSQETALKALRALAREGWITIVPRGRMFVRARPRERIVVRDRTVYRDEIGYFFDLNAKDWRPVGKPERTLAVPPDHIADLLGTPRGEDVVARNRAMGPPGSSQALQLATSYISMALATEIPALRAENPGPGGIYDRIEEAFDQSIEWHEVISSRLPDETEQERLDIPPTVPVMIVTRESRVERNGSVLVAEVNETRMSAEQFAVSYTVRRDDSAVRPGGGAST